MKILSRSFYRRSTALVAEELLGNILVREWNGIYMAGIIAETEAYGSVRDTASHACKRETKRNKAMFGPVGHSYIYFIYGNHYCLNIVARSSGVQAGAVLIRSIIPIHGITTMKRLRSIDTIAHLADGPGKIGQALHLNCSHNHIDMANQEQLYVVHGVQLNRNDIEITERIGITKAQDKQWRYAIKNERVAQAIEHCKQKGII